MDDLKLYVLKEYNDGLAYGSESLQIFVDWVDAVNKLRKDFCKWAGIKDSDWLHAPQLLHAGKDDIFSKEYVSMYDPGKGSNQFFVVEELKLDRSASMELFSKVERSYDREDARQILQEIMENQGIELSDEDQNQIISDSVAWYRDFYDWTEPAYDQLKSCVNDEVEARRPRKSMNGGKKFYE